MCFDLDHPQPRENVQYTSLEEGTFENGVWVTSRAWNGDQIDYGLNLTAQVLLKVRMGTYR